MKPKFRSLRQRWHTLLGSRTVKLDGIILNAEAARVGEDVRRELVRGTYEFAERRLLQSVLRPGDRVLEIGAGIGCIGLAAARIVGSENVVSYEANPDLIPMIRANHELNGLEPQIIAMAVTRDGGEVTFNVTENLLSSSLTDRGGDAKLDRSVGSAGECACSAQADGAGF